MLKNIIIINLLILLFGILLGIISGLSLIYQVYKNRGIILSFFRIIFFLISFYYILRFNLISSILFIISFLFAFWFLIIKYKNIVF